MPTTSNNYYNHVLNELYNFDQTRNFTLTPPSTTQNWGYGYLIRSGLSPIKRDYYEVVMESGEFIFKKKNKKKFYIDI